MFTHLLAEINADQEEMKPKVESNEEEETPK
jgi:hypothetical protein